MTRFMKIGRIAMKTESLRFKILRELFIVRRSLTADALADRLSIVPISSGAPAEDGRSRVAWSLGWLVREGYAVRKSWLVRPGTFHGRRTGFFPRFELTERGREFVLKRLVGERKQ